MEKRNVQYARHGIEIHDTKMKAFFERIGSILVLLGQTISWCKVAHKNLGSILNQMLKVGVNTLPLVSLVSLFIGMVIAFQTGHVLAKFKLESFVGRITGNSLTREINPVIMALILAGRVGAAMAAELGTMNISEEIDALKTMAINPVRYLVMPRFLACIIMLPVLVIYANVIGIIGGLFIAKSQLGVDSQVYLKDAMNFLTIKDVFSGLVKAAVFGAIVVIVSCYQGLKARGGAEGVGKATTDSIVLSFTFIFIFDYFLTWMFY